MQVDLGFSIARNAATPPYHPAFNAWAREILSKAAQGFVELVSCGSKVDEEYLVAMACTSLDKL
jgi:hypothetical protein